MAYNISEVTTSTTTDFETWTFSLARADRTAMVDGDFDVDIFDTGEPTGINAPNYALTYVPGREADFFNLVPQGAPGDFIDADGMFTFEIDWTEFDAQIADGTIVKDLADGRYEYADDDTPVVVAFTVVGSSPTWPFGSGVDTNTVLVEFLICVARGTRVMTAQGERRVEELEVGDLIRTGGGRIKPICWIGSRVLSVADLEEQPDLKPVRISAHAMGSDLPDRDLIVSPQHRIVVTGWQAQLLFGEDTALAPAKGLVNGHTIRNEQNCDGVEYFHLLFDQHEVILTNNLPTESFFPGPTTLSEVAEDVRQELFRIFPELQDNPAIFGPMVHIGLRPWEAGLIGSPS